VPTLKEAKKYAKIKYAKILQALAREGGFRRTNYLFVSAKEKWRP
jgi:hypothetical protein